MLDKFRRTGPATPGLEILLLLFDSLFLESLLVAVALGGSAGNEEKSGPASPYPPMPPPRLICIDVCAHIALMLSPRFALGLLPHTIAPRGPFSTTCLGARGQTGSSMVRSLALS